MIGQGGQVEVLQLTSLCRLHIQELETNGFPNFEYRSEQLKALLEQRDIHESIAFVDVNPGDKGFITFNLVYSVNISLASAVACAD